MKKVVLGLLAAALASAPVLAQSNTGRSADGPPSANQV